MVENGRGQMRQGGTAIWIVERRAGDGLDVGLLRMARRHELAGVPVVGADVLLGAGKRSAGPAYKGGKWGGPRVF